MRKIFFRKLLTAMGITLGACLLFYPLLLPTENYFRLVLQLFPVALFTGLLLLIPLYIISERFSRGVTSELKTLKLDSKQAIADYPELRPVARQIMSFRMQMEAQRNELEGQQEQLKVLTDNMQEGLLLVSATGRVLSYNHAALQLLDKESVSGDFDVFELNDGAVFRGLVNNALNGVRGSAVITVSDTACQLFANPVTRGSMMTGAVLVLLDVTEREKRDALRREFTSNVSHELKTPLTSIYGIADMMESGMVKAEDISGFAKRIRDESARMIALIEDIIRLSRLDDDSFTEEVLPIDLCEIAENVRSQLIPQAEKKGIEMTLEGDSAPMQGVPVIVEEMLYNLCDNAIKYNKEKGAVHMKVTCTEQSAIFTVTDTGIGVPQADRERIFERFYRVDKSHSKQIGGTGLGLSIVKHGAQFHNAKIELESQLGSGTTITLFFPRSAEAAALAERDARLNPLDVEVPGAKQRPETVSVHKTEDAVQPAAENDAEEAEFIFVTEDAEPEAEAAAKPEQDSAKTPAEQPEENLKEQPGQMPDAEKQADAPEQPEAPAEVPAEQPEQPAKKPAKRTKKQKKQPEDQKQPAAAEQTAEMQLELPTEPQPEPLTETASEAAEKAAAETPAEASAEATEKAAAEIPAEASAEATEEAAAEAPAETAEKAAPEKPAAKRRTERKSAAAQKNAAADTEKTAEKAAPEQAAGGEPDRKPARRRNILDENTEELTAELEMELAGFAPPLREQPVRESKEIEIPIGIPVHFPADGKAVPPRTGRLPFDPDIVPIDETTMDIKI